MPRQDALLTRERNVIEVLVDRDLDREQERVAATRRCTLGARRGLDAAAAAAHVLLPLDLHDAIAHVDDIDHLGRLELPFHRQQAAAARGADPIGVVQLVHDRHVRQRGLRRRAKLRARLGRLALDRTALARLRVLVGRRTLRDDLLQQRERLLQLAGLPPQLVELLALRSQDAQQLLDLHLLRLRDAAKLLEVALALQVHAPL
jgi:hypothetical protein